MKATNGTAPEPKAYYHGRFCNGPIWADYMGAALNGSFDVRVFNYAFGGAHACPNPSFAARFPFVSDLATQTAEFLADKAAGLLPTTGDYIFIQFLGTNDVNSLLRTNPSPQQLQDGIAAIVGCKIQSLQALVVQGGARDVVVVPLGPLEYSPAIPQAFKPVVAQVVDATDAATAGAVGQLQAALSGTGAKVTMLGSNNDFEAGISVVGFANVATACLPILGPGGSRLQANPNITVCADPSSYFLYDENHPTTRFQNWIAMGFLVPRLQALGLLPATF